MINKITITIQGNNLNDSLPKFFDHILHTCGKVTDGDLFTGSYIKDLGDLGCYHFSYLRHDNIANDEITPPKLIKETADLLTKEIDNFINKEK